MATYAELLQQINRLVSPSILGINGGSNAFGNQLKVILVEMLGLSQAQTVANNIFVFSPGNPAPANNQFTDFTQLYNAVSAITGPFVIQLDNSFAPVVFPAGTYDLTGGVVSGPVNVATPITVTFNDGCIFVGNPVLANFTTTFVGTQAVISLTNGQRQVLDRVIADATSTAPLIAVLGSTPLLVLKNGTQLKGNGTGKPVLNLNSFILSVQQSGQSFLAEKSTGGTAAAVLNLFVLEGNSFVDMIAPPVFLGTFNVEYDDLASLHRYFDNVQDPEILDPAEPQTVQNALDAFKRLTDGGGPNTDTVQTTDATPTTLFTIPLDLSDGVLLVQANVVADAPAPANQRAAYVLRARYTVTAGVPAVFNAAQDYISEDVPAWDAVLTVVAGVAVLQVTGAAATTIDWRAFLTITRQGT